MSGAAFDPLEACPACGADLNWLQSRPLDFTEDGQATETIECQQCGATIRQTWTLTDREVVPG